MCPLSPPSPPVFPPARLLRQHTRVRPSVVGRRWDFSGLARLPACCMEVPPAPRRSTVRVQACAAPRACCARLGRVAAASGSGVARRGAVCRLLRAAATESGPASPPLPPGLSGTARTSPSPEFRRRYRVRVRPEAAPGATERLGRPRFLKRAGAGSRAAWRGLAPWRSHTLPHAHAPLRPAPCGLRSFRLLCVR